MSAPVEIRRLPAAELREAFDSAAPFRHVVIESFLDEGFVQRLLAEFPSFDSADSRNEYGERAGKAVRPDLPRIGEAYRALDSLIKSEGFLGWLGEVTGIDDLVYDPQYVGGGTHENVPGQELDPHVDFNFHPDNGLHRRLNLILFLNPEWEDSWGGVLELHRNPRLPPEQDVVSRVAPLLNRCVVFETTEDSWHGFRRIESPGVTRRSIAVYFYSREREPQATAPSHGTVYVPRPVEGGDDVQTQIKRRDDLIEFLYGKEKELQGELEALRGELPGIHSGYQQAQRRLEQELKRERGLFEQRSEAWRAELSEVREGFEAKVRELEGELAEVHEGRRKADVELKRERAEVAQRVASLEAELARAREDSRKTREELEGQLEGERRTHAEQVEKFRAAVEGIRSSLSFRLGRILTWPLRMFR